jgi:hypothetical protein
MIPATVERRARWVLDTIGAHDAGFGDDVPYRESAWEQVERGERPEGDDLAEAFFHLARVEERRGERDRHGRFRASASWLDPLDPPLERLRLRLQVAGEGWMGGRFAVALTHDVDIPWRWTRIGVRGAAARLKSHVRRGRAAAALAEARALSALPLHKVRGTDPNWTYERIGQLESSHGANSTFFLLAGHRHRADGPAPEVYEQLRPRLVEAVRAAGAEVALHGSYTAAEDVSVLAAEKEVLERLAGPVRGNRYHYLRVDPHANLAPLERLEFSYDTSLGFAETPGFRAGIARPFRPWDFEHDRPLGLVEIPLVAMDVTLSEARYLALSARAAEPRILALVDFAARTGGAFAVNWHVDRFDRGTAHGWDRLYTRLLDEVHARGGVCVSAGELAEAAADRLRAPSGGDAAGALRTATRAS